MRKALKAASFDSVRGPFKFNANQYPIQNYYVRTVGSDGKGGLINKSFNEPILKNHGDAYVQGCTMKVRRGARVATRRLRRTRRLAGMPGVLLLEQALNGLQFGLMLFLLAAGLTLVFGVMDMINLAHGSLYMVGAFLAAWLVAADRLVRARRGRRGALTGLFGMALEAGLLRTLYARDHLSQVLATFALILILNDGVKMIFGNDLPLSAPAALAGPVELLPGLQYPAYRLLILGVGLALAVLLWLLVQKTRMGALVRAGASNRADGDGDGHQHHAPLHDRLRHRRHALRRRRRAARAAARGAGRHGREHPDPRLRRHRHRRYRLDPRRARRRRPGRLHRHPRPHRVAAGASRVPAAAVGQRGRAGLRVGRRLRLHGRRCWRSGRRGCFRRAPDGGANARRLPIPRRPCGAGRRPTISAARSSVGVALPFVLHALGFGFYLSLASRIVVYAIAATSLNLVLGYAGLVSFGHAAFVGLGAYATGDPGQRGRAERLLHLLATLAVTGLAALVDRRDLAAHARRLLHHDHARLRADAVLPRELDEGLRRRRGPEHPHPLVFGFGTWALDLKNPLALYYVALAVLALRCSRWPASPVALRPRRAGTARR